MLKDQLKKQVKKELESLGERVGKSVAKRLSKTGDNKGARVGKKVGKAVGEQVERLHGALEKETVTKQDELGIGGKIGTGLGIMGRHLVEKRYGFLGKLMGSTDLISNGRTMGAKTEKIVKRAVKKGVERVASRKGRSSKPKDKNDKG